MAADAQFAPVSWVWCRRELAVGRPAQQGAVARGRSGHPSLVNSRYRGFADSPLEGDGFEFPVPREIGSVSTLGEE